MGWKGSQAGEIRTLDGYEMTPFSYLPGCHPLIETAVMVINKLTLRHMTINHVLFNSIILL